LATLTTPPGQSATPARKPGPIVGRNNRTKLGARAAFLKEFIKAPHVMAAVAPSSRRLGQAMVQGIDLSHARTIVEYGPGTGTFTRAVLDEIGPDWFASALTDPIGGAAAPTRRFIAIEFNKTMSELLQEQHPEVTVVNDSAENVESICAARHVPAGEVDFVLSGLGWPSFNDDFRTRTLEATARVLRPGGEFRTFGYHVGLLMRGAWHFRAEVRRLFKHVEIGRIVWGNMPPAFVYRCIK
jgi:phospholipid N-methyltransferase